jgi:hypothetical protein
MAKRVEDKYTDSAGLRRYGAVNQYWLDHWNSNFGHEHDGRFVEPIRRLGVTVAVTVYHTDRLESRHLHGLRRRLRKDRDEGHMGPSGAQRGRHGPARELELLHAITLSPHTT